jgi:hypothetical protein
MSYIYTGDSRSFSVTVTKYINGVPQTPVTYPTVVDIANGYFTYTGGQVPIPTPEELAQMDASAYAAILIALQTYAQEQNPGLNFATATVVVPAVITEDPNWPPSGTPVTTTTTTVAPITTTTTVALPCIQALVTIDEADLNDATGNSPDIEHPYWLDGVIYLTYTDCTGAEATASWNSPVTDDVSVCVQQGGSFGSLYYYKNNEIRAITIGTSTAILLDNPLVLCGEYSTTTTVF